MEAWELIVFGAGLVCPLYLLTRYEQARLSDPRHVVRFGAAVPRERVRPAHGASIVGSLGGCPIHAEVEYLGMRYRFDRAMPESYRRAVRPRELYVEPGLVYVREQT